VHAADVEGLCQGIDSELVTSTISRLAHSSRQLFLTFLLAELGEWVTIPTTYAGGAKDISDLEFVDRLSNGRVDLTYGRLVC
jgi:phosphoribosylformimino-5-aminoimidazole carboxamide ribotide isomerase